jgi:hypothetical protein
MTTKRVYQNADDVILGTLAYEFRSSMQSESEATIRKRLRYYKYGKYNPQRVEMMRQLIAVAKKEFHPIQESKYFLGYHPENSTRDFDLEQMVVDYQQQYPDVAPSALRMAAGNLFYAYYLS